MNNKKKNEMDASRISQQPTAEQKINYIYGLLNAEETAHFEKLLKQFPELAAEMQQTKQLLEVMQDFPEIEAPEPPLLVVDKKKVITSPALKMPVFNRFTQLTFTLVASFAILMVVGALTHMEVGLHHEGFFIRFGSHSSKADQGQKPQPEITAQSQDIRKEIHVISKGTENKQNQALSQELHALKITLNALNQQFDRITNQVPASSLATSKINLSDAQVKQLLLVLTKENTRMLEQAFGVAQAEQRQQLEDALQNFAYYLSRIRQEDMQSILTNLEALNLQSEIKSRETDQALEALFQSLQSRNTP